MTMNAIFFHDFVLFLTWNFQFIIIIYISILFHYEHNSITATSQFHQTFPHLVPADILQIFRRWEAESGADSIVIKEK